MKNLSSRLSFVFAVVRAMGPTAYAADARANAQEHHGVESIEVESIGGVASSAGK